MAENTPGDMSEAQFLTIAEVAARMRVSIMASGAGRQWWMTRRRSSITIR